MRARTVIKASLSAVCAVFATLVLCLSLPQGGVAASKTAKDISQTVYAIVSTQKAKPAAPAPTIAVVAAQAPTLLPIVDQPSIHINQQLLADAVLRRLPSLCRDNLKNFYILYQGATQRGLGGKTTIIIDGNVGDNEFVGLLAHECGHVIHGNMLGNIASGASAFKDGNDVFAKGSPAAQFFSISWVTANVMKAGMKKEDFVTGYAQTNIFEDFAETFATYVLERPSMEQRAKTDPVIAAKLQWMNQYLPLPENVLGTPEFTWNGNVPWDATKLSFEWNPTAI